MQSTDSAHAMARDIIIVFLAGTYVIGIPVDKFSGILRESLVNAELFNQLKSISTSLKSLTEKYFAICLAAVNS